MYLVLMVCHCRKEQSFSKMKLTKNIFRTSMCKLDLYAGGHRPHRTAKTDIHRRYQLLGTCASPLPNFVRRAAEFSA